MRSASRLVAVAALVVSCADQDVARAPQPGPSGGSAPVAGAAGSAGAPAEPSTAGASLGAAPAQNGGAPETSIAGGSSDAGDPPSSPQPPPDDEPPRQPSDDADRLPCDVQRLLRSRCQSCHTNPPIGGASVALLSFADLTSLSRVVPTASVAARSLQRMRDSLSPMPPAPATRATPAEIATLQAWLTAGSPPGTCDDEPSSTDNRFDAQPTCSSSSYWTAYESGSPWMNPGLPCIKCHRQYPNFAPRFTVAGTVFPTAHEPDKCFGVPASTGAAVIITDANGQELPPIQVVSGGNFGAILADLAVPYRAKVVVGDSERVMVTPQTNGDCNTCHTQTGAEGAPGRVIVP